ncbi:hypothetical protein ACIPRL_07815 [Streptomyces sp. NPDC090085]|uniref:hypothetical protein n=1 Tax=Streptomyces sp. NPDC090085 TaxID=3365943 RepID=UPI00381A716F
MTADELARITRYTIAADLGHGARRGGIAALASYRDPAAPRRETRVLVHVTELPDTVTGIAVAHGLAQLLAALPAPVPVRLLLGVTLVGDELASQVITPTLTADLKAAVRDAEARGDRDAAAIARRPVRTTTYSLDVGAAASEATTMVRLHRRIGSVTAGLELGELKIPETLPLAPDVRRAISSYNPLERTTEFGYDAWGAAPFEGVLSALTVAYSETRSGLVRLFLPRGSINQGTASLHESSSVPAAGAQPPALYASLAGVPRNYVDHPGLSGTVPDDSTGRAYTLPTGAQVDRPAGRRIADAVDDWARRR